MLCGSWAFQAATACRWEEAIFNSWLFVADPAAHASIEGGAAAIFVGWVMTCLGLVIFGFIVSVMGSNCTAHKSLLA